MDSAGWDGLDARLAALLEAPLEIIMSSAEEDLGAVAIPGFLPGDVASSLEGELKDSPEWVREYWEFEGRGVRMIDEAGFAASGSPFSNSSVVPEESRHRLPRLERLQQVLGSPVIARTVTKNFGLPVEFTSLAVNRYDQDTYLVRHADLFGSRVFGLVLFVSSGWHEGSGGELKVYSQSGTHHKVRPMLGDAALFAIHPRCSHAVMRVRTPDWVRMSLAAHYGAELKTEQAWQQALALRPYSLPPTKMPSTAIV